MDFPSFSKIKGFVFDHPFLSVGITHAILITLYSVFTFFWGSGHIVFIDLTEGITLSDASNRIYYAYANNWGEAIAEKQRIIPFTILWILYKGLYLAEENFVPFRILFGYYLSIIGFVFMLSSFKSIGLKAKGWWLFGAIFASTAFYLYNPWMTNRILHNFLYFSTFTVVMHVGLLYRSLLKKPDNRLFYVYILLNGTLLGTFLTTPHTALLILIVTLPLLILALINKNYLRTLAYILLVPLIALVTGLYWLLPFILYKPLPDRVESFTILDMLSQKASLFNVLKLQGYWWDKILPGYFPTYFTMIPGSSWLFDILYLIPLLFLIYAIYYYRKLKISYFIISVFIISILLASYTYFSEPFYKYIMFENHYTSIVGWLFREIEKFSYLTALAYSLGIFLVLNVRNVRLLRAFYAFCVLITILNFSYLLRYTNMNLRKVPVPGDYYEINKFLLKDKSQYNIAYYPQGQFLIWSKSVDSANYISNLSSDKPALPNVEGDSYTKNFLNTILDLQLLDHIDLGDALNTIGVKYLIIRNDLRGRDLSDLNSSLEKQQSLVRIWEGQYLTLYQNNSYNGLLEVKDKNLVTNMGYNFLEKLSVSGESLADYLVSYTDMPNGGFELYKENTSFILDDFGFLDLAINKFSNDFIFPSDYTKVANPNSDWGVVSLTNKTHAEYDLYFNNFDITNRQFNYDKEVVLSLGGLSFNEKFANKFKELQNSLIFFNKEGFKAENKIDSGIEINFQGRENDYAWNIYKTNKIDVTNIKALGFEGLYEGESYLEPHIKFYYYDQSFNQLGVQAFYPEQNKFEGVFKIPRDAVYLDFSVWVRGKGFGKIGYSLKNLKIYDVGESYLYPEISLDINNIKCKQDCALYARVLESSNYPSKLEIYVDDIKVLLNNTRNTSKYRWVKVAGIPAKDNYHVRIVNLEGFNSVAAFVVLNDSELLLEEQRYIDYLSSQDFEKSFFDGGVFYQLKSSFLTPKGHLDKYIIYSPVKYAFDIDYPNAEGYLVFKKPFKPAWTLTCNDQRQNALKSESVVWRIGVGDKSCKIAYYPQILYANGLLVSGLGILGASLTILLLLFNRHKSPL